MAGVAVQRSPHLRLVLVPRHQERFEEVASLVQSRGLPLLRRSQIKAGTPFTSDAFSEGRRESEILLLDTLGELGATAQRLVLLQQGATARTVQLLTDVSSHSGRER